MNVTQIMQLAVAHHQAGRLAEADRIYAQVLAQIPAHPDALHLRGVLMGRLGRTDDAIELIVKAIAVNPNAAEFHFHLGIALKAGGKLDEAAVAYRRAVELSPMHAQAHCNLGVALKAAGKIEEAIAAYRAGLERCPDFVELHNNLGAALADVGKFDEAIGFYHRVLQSRPNDASVHSNLASALRSQRKIEEGLVSCRRALELQPDYVPANHTLGLLLHDKGQLDEAAAVFRRVIQLQPDYALAYSNLGRVLRAKRQVDESIAQYERALELKPDSADVHFNLAILRRDKGQIEEATAACRASLRLTPDAAESHSTLGILLKDEGRLDESIEAYQRGMELQPDDARIRANFLYTILFHPRFDAAAIFREHREWDRRFGEPLGMRIEAHANERDANRRLRIGYVSCDFRDHVVGRNMQPLFVHHDRGQFEIHFFSNVTRSDARTGDFQKLCDRWHDVTAINDEELAKLVGSEKIDILVDLTLHMGGNRLLAFARKPAPVQVTFAGYPGTTGLKAIDYRLTDPYLDPFDATHGGPVGAGDEFYSERSIRLGDSFWCYDPLDSQAEVNDLPAISAGHVTFGCLSNFCKINDGVLDLWANVLLGVRNSRLFLVTPPGSVWDRLVGRFAERGISSDRLERVGYQPRRDYLQLYHGIDIGLDTLPYNGHSTSLDSFWMGVPVITLVGSTVVGRAGLSQLTNLKLGELIAETPERFVEIVTELAGDLPRLKELRSTLRERMRGSPLMDAGGFARGIEAAYRGMWRGWCEGVGI